MMKKKLLFLNGHLNPGGVERALVDILRHVDYSKYEVDLLLFEELGAYLEQIPKEVNVRLVDLHNTYGSVASSLSRCIQVRDWLCFKMRVLFLLKKIFGAKVLRFARNIVTGEKDYDVAIGFRSGLCTELVAYAVDCPKKITWWHHGEYNLSETNARAYQKNCRQLSYIVAVSEGCASFLRDHHPELSDSIKVIPNMVPVEEIQDKADMFNPYTNHVTWKIVSVGRLSPEKHVENCVYAAKKLLTSNVSDFIWYIVGDGEERDKLEKLVDQQGLKDYVVFVGSQSNPYPYMKNAGLFVHPSYVESQGLVVLEAMALGVPCVATRSRGPCEFIQDGENALLTEQTPEGLAEKAMQMLQNADLYNRIKINTYCPPNFMPEKVMEQIENLLET